MNNTQGHIKKKRDRHPYYHQDFKRVYSRAIKRVQGIRARPNLIVIRVPVPISIRPQRIRPEKNFITIAEPIIITVRVEGIGAIILLVPDREEITVAIYEVEVARTVEISIPTCKLWPLIVYLHPDLLKLERNICRHLSDMLRVQRVRLASYLLTDSRSVHTSCCECLRL